MSPITGINSPPVPLTREALLDALASASLDAVIAVDHDGHIIRWSSKAEEIFGWTEAEALGLTIHETIIPERDRPAHVAGLASYKAGSKPNIFGSRFKRTAIRIDGTEIPVELSIMCIQNLGGDLLVSFIRDLSEEERSRKSLEELQMRLVHVSRTSAMATMATTLAHELNQPLAAASNFLSATTLLMERGDWNSIAEAKLGVTRSQAAIKRAADTIKSVRQMVEKKPLRLRPYRLRPLVHDAIKLLGTSLRVRAWVEIDADAEWVLTSKVQIEQVVINLLRNASDATHDTAPPIISLKAVKSADEVQITVTDNGPGIPAERMENLFTPFNSTKPDGLGMGLSICRTLVEQNEGRMWATSEPGRTEIHFTVPVASKG